MERPWKWNNEFFCRKAKRILSTADDRYKCRRDGSPELRIQVKNQKNVLKYFWKTP